MNKSKTCKNKKTKKIVKKQSKIKTKKPKRSRKKTIVKKTKPLPIPFSDINLDDYPIEKDFDIDSDEYQKIKIKTKKKSFSPKIYWTSNTENSIRKYIETEDMKLKNSIYENELRVPFEKMAENIMNTFRFEYFETDKETAMVECLGHVMTNITKFDPYKFKGKSFGYFSVMMKNFFILSNNSTHKKWKIHESIDFVPEDSSEEFVKREKFYTNDHVKDHLNDKKEFINLLISYWNENVNLIFKKEIEIKIVNSILEILKYKDVDIYNKKYIYFCIKEMCNCKTQHLTKVINKMKRYQKLLVNKYLEKGNLTETEQYSDKMVSV